MRCLVACIGLVVLAGACGSPEDNTVREDASRVWVDLDNSDPERLLRFYFGGFVGSEGGDPFAAGLLFHDDGRFHLDMDALEERLPGAAAALQPAADDQRLEWEELAVFLNDSYYAVRQLPPTLDALRSEVPYRDTTGWFHVALDGVMTTARRHVYVTEAALRAALAGYRQQGERLFYPTGAVIVGEHVEDGALVETTVMRKRGDGFWDFFTYGTDGALTTRTRPSPRSLKTPTQCVGCHFGAKLFEPERSFPGEAPPGPHGPRALYVEERFRDRDVVVFFDEHRKRSDTVLGIYNTLFVAGLRADRREGRLSDEDVRLLTGLGL